LTNVDKKVNFSQITIVYSFVDDIIIPALVTLKLLPTLANSNLVFKSSTKIKQ